ncbi:MAG: hypothetical protein ACE5KM_05230 [Planctomycetaceae bacterium]
MSRRLLVSLAAGVAATFVLLWWTDWPLGVPGEWTWQRSAISGDALWLVFVAACAGGSYAAAASWVLPRIDASGGKGKTAGWLSLSAAAGFVVLWAVDSTAQWPRSAPPEDRAGDRADLKRAWTLYDSGASGYLEAAVRSDQSTADFLAGYEAEMAKGDSLHIGTHPPGLILLHRGLLAICRASPVATRLTLAIQPQAVAEAFADLERAGGIASRRLPDSDRAALWLAVLLTYATAALAVVPLFLLVRGDFGPRVAWMTAAFWPFVPALAVFLPKSDALFPFIGLLFVLCWRGALRRRSFLLAAASGLVMWCGLLLSLALLPVALFAVVLTVWETLDASERGPAAPRLRRGFLLAGTAIAAFAAATIVFCLSTGANLPVIWEWNFENHARFYDAYERTYWKWLPVNAVELTLATGWPIVLLVAMRVAQIVGLGEARHRGSGPAIAGLAVVALLWISGKNMGEAARLWLFLTPWLLWITAGWWRRAAADDRISRTWMTVLLFQFAVCLITVLRVTGLTFAGM